MAAKAKLLLRELKTVKADLAFAKERCTQLEEENKALRDSRHKGDSHEDDDLIRLQLETLLAEKGRLAHENSVYARENRFLREIVEYHQLTMQDVLQMDDGDNEEDVSNVVIFGPTNQQNSCPHSSEHSEASSHVSSIPCMLSAMPSSMIPEVSSPVPSPPTSPLAEMEPPIDANLSASSSPEAIEERWQHI